MDSQTANQTAIRAIIASQFIPPFMFSGVAVALPSMGADLHMGAASLGLVEILFLASQLTFMLPMGRLADTLDKRALYKLAIAAFALASMALAFMPWVAGVLFLRMVQGLCSAIFASTGPALLADMVPPEKRGEIFGKSIGAIYAGLTLGPLCAGLLVDAFGWHSLFIASALLLTAGYILLHYTLPKTKLGSPRGAVHISSVFMMGVIVGALVTASVLTAQGWPALLALGIGIVTSIAFVRLQLHLDSPLIDVRALIANHALRGALASQVLLYINAFCSVFLLSLYMQVPLQHGPRAAGYVIALGTVCMALAAPYAGKLADKWPRRTLCAAGVSMVLAASIGALLFFGMDTPLVVVGIMLTVQSLGFALFSSPNMTLIMNSVPPSQSGLASALGAKARSMGMVIGMLVTGALMAHAMGTAPVTANPELFMGVMHLNFALLALTSAAALWLCLQSKRI